MYYVSQLISWTLGQLVPLAWASTRGPMTDPWDEGYIYLHEWLNFFMVNVGKYTSPMDPMWLIFIVNVSKYTSPMDPMGNGDVPPEV